MRIKLFQMRTIIYQTKKYMYRSNHRINMDILHALSGSFKSKKYVFIYPNNLMLMVSILDISMLIVQCIIHINKKPLIFTDKWPTLHYKYII